MKDGTPKQFLKDNNLPSIKKVGTLLTLDSI
jgi:hypothetical protein